MVKKKQNKNWIYVVLVVLALVLLSNFQQGRSSNQSPVQITARYYDADGNLIGTSGRGFSLQSVFGQNVETLPTQTANVELSVSVTNTGNGPFEFAVETLTTQHNNQVYPVLDYILIGEGQTLLVPSLPVNVEDSFEDSEVHIKIIGRTDEDTLSEVYRWRYNKPLSGSCMEVEIYKTQGYTTHSTTINGCEIVKKDTMVNDVCHGFSYYWDESNRDLWGQQICQDEHGMDFWKWDLCGTSGPGNPTSVHCAEYSTDYKGGDGVTTSTCFQETATVSTTCGGLSTGSYVGTHANWYDGVYGSGLVQYGELTSTFKKPVGALSTSEWGIKEYSSAYGLSTYNIELDPKCWSAYPDEIVLKAVVSPTASEGGHYCYDGEGWIKMSNFNTPAVKFFDEWVDWVIVE